MDSVPLDEQFCCCICLHIYTEPVSLPCGHNFCLDCIDGFWDTRDSAECPLCKETFRNRPDLRVNREFAEVVEYFKRSWSLSPRQEEDVKGNSESEEVCCDVCPGDKSTAVRSCLMCQASYCEIHLTSHLRRPGLQRHRLTDPATFANSHLCRNHNMPLEMFCRVDQTPVCVKCTKKDHKQHDSVPIAKESKRIKAHLRQTKSDIQQLIQDKLRKVEQVKHSVDQSKNITQREIQNSSQVCGMLIATIERHRAGLVEELRGRQEDTERRAKELLKELQHEINELQMRSSELEHLELTQNLLHLLQSYPSLSGLPSTRDWSEVAFHADNCMGTVRRAVEKLVDVCQELANKLSAAEADKMIQHAVDVTLDPATASDWVTVSADGKEVSLSCQKKKDRLPDGPQRFDRCVCVLGKQSFTSGRRYWEVQVGDKADWDLGVARSSVNRKGAITVHPHNGFWAICRRKGARLRAYAEDCIMYLRDTPQRVGVFLDYEEGVVSFHDAEAKTHIYTYSGCAFAEPLHPYFSAPIVICPVEAGKDTRCNSC